MATSSGGYIDQDIVGEAGPLVAGVGVWTALLTASLLGVVGLVSGTVVGLFALTTPLPTWEARAAFAVRVGAVVWILVAVPVYLYARRAAG